MTHPILSLGTTLDMPVLLAIGTPLLAAAAVLIGWAIRRRSLSGRSRKPSSPAVKVAALAALGCTAYSADTSWRFAADYLDMAGTAERAAMFGAAELALFATALMARQNLASQGAPGLPGTLVWVITGVQVIPAYAESGPVGGTVRAFVGPIMAAMLWHLAMGIELRLRTPGAASHGLIAVLGREARERLLSRLGVAARDRDAAQITRDRATVRAVALAARLAEYSPRQRASWRGRRLTRRLSKAIGRASVGTDPAQRAELLHQLAARRHALALATVALPSPWSHPARDRELVPATASVPAPSGGTVLLHREGAVPADGPRAQDEQIGDRSSLEQTGPVPGTEFPPPDNTVPGTGDHPADRGDRPHGGPGGTKSTGDRGDGGSGTDDAAGDTGGNTEQSHENAAQATVERPDAAPEGDRGIPGGESGTDHHGDQDTRTVPLRRKPEPKGKQSRSRSGQQAKRPPKESPLPVDQLVQQVRPHVPALLERDGNDAITRVQLREILRREGLKGGRNDRLGLVLAQLRQEANTTMTRSNSR